MLKTQSIASKEKNIFEETEERLKKYFDLVERLTSISGLKDILHIICINGAIGGNRTHDLRLTKAPLYPLATMARI